jgi:predicted NBD/HSP70 family sugar kinase
MIVAVDTGGTKTLVAVFNTDGEIVRDQKFPTPTDINDYLTQLKATIDELIAADTITCLSVALPGTIVDGKMIWAGNLGWHDTDIRSLLSSHYDCPIVVENDANLAGLAEARALKDIPRVCLYVTVSTGIGTGIITNGQIDPNFSTSESGQIMLEHDGTLERWESFASGKAIMEKYGT